MDLIRDGMAQKRRDDLESDYSDTGRIETMAVELKIKSEKWIVISVYKQPTVKAENLLMYWSRTGYLTCAWQVAKT